ncbi:hypothetical protein [Desulforapulum autotrophicum]|jgi:hypothetical protein|nr:hypothetical protein [Desulforapulum autotrophicum]
MKLTLGSKSFIEAMALLWAYAVLKFLVAFDVLGNLTMASIPGCFFAWTR